MTEEQRAELEKLARAAERDFGAVDIAVGGGMRGTETVPAFIAAASPTVSLDLLATIARLEAERDEWKQAAEVEASERRRLQAERVKDGEALEAAMSCLTTRIPGGVLHGDHATSAVRARLSSRAKDQSQ